MKEKVQKIFKDKYNILILIIIVIGIAVRVINIQNMPNALNTDEASAGYESYSILNYGIDRNGNFMPAFLVAWGSGQNALLTYLMMPFITLFGLNTLSIRLPMAILGCISLIIMYALLKKIGNKKVAIIGLVFFAICPWHIMKSRWGLESNLFPDLVLIFVYLLVKGLMDKNKILYYISFVIAGLTAFSYGTSYFFLPIFLIPTLIILVKKKEITIKQAIISIFIVGIISLPIIAFVIINTFNLEQINLPFITIPKLQVNRYKEITSIFSSKFFEASLSNFLSTISILLWQKDGLEWNSIEPFGITYIFSEAFTIIGIIYSFKKNKKVEIEYGYVFNIWFIVSIVLSFICEPNINRLNIMMIPIVYYTIIGIYIVIDEKKNFTIPIMLIYFVFFGWFIYTYFQQNFDLYYTFESNLEEPIKYVSEIKDKQVYITNKIREPYIYVLFYEKNNTYEFVNTVKYIHEHEEFRQVNSFDNYYFSDISKLEKDKVYVIKRNDLQIYNINYDDFTITEFENYLVLEGKI